MSQAINATTPVGRLVAGSLYKGQDKDAEGKPLVVKHGPNAGQPRLDWYFAVAIPKGPEQHWGQTAWGAQIWNVGNVAFPNAAQSPKFSWKVTDGDSQVPNGKGKRPCDREGWPGHWVVHFSSGYPPNVYQIQNGQTVPFAEKEAVKTGHFVQVNFTCAGNGSQQQPGVYLNHKMVCFIAYGPEIVVGPDPSSAGFGGQPLPAGATMTPPPGAFAAMAQVPGAIPGAPPLVPGVPGVPGAAPLPGAPVAPVAAPVPGYAPAVGAMPQPAMASAAAAVMPPPVAPVAAVNPTLQPVPGAQYSIEQCRAGGWTDDQIVGAGYATRLVAPAAAVPLPPTTFAPAPAAPAAPIAPAPTGVTPNPAFVAVPGVAVPAMPGMPPAPPGAPRLQMTAAANGQTYEGFKAAGWTDDAMVAQGFAVRVA